MQPTASVGAPPSPTPPYIPPELRGHIARFCDRRSLARLCSVDRLWAAETEPVLYNSVFLFLEHDNSNNAIHGFIDGLTRSALRASYVLRLLVEHGGPGNGVTPDVLPALGNTLATLPALVDLRLRGHNIYVQSHLLMILTSSECRFRLHTLYLSQRLVVETPNFFKDVLRAHAASLKMLGINGVDPRHLWNAARADWQDPDDGHWLNLTEPLRADCTRFAFVRQPRRIALAVYAAVASRIEAVARSLAVDPCAQFSDTAVETLHLQWFGQPRVELCRAFHAHFPQITRVAVHIPLHMVTIDLNAVAETVAPFSLLQVLHIMGLYPVPRLVNDVPTSLRIKKVLRDAGY